MFGPPKPPPPPAPPPPPPNPPTYATAAAAGPSQRFISPYAGLGASILTSPSGALDQGTTRRKSLLGQ